MTNTTDITTTEEGIKKLSELEGVASENLHASKEAFNTAMMAIVEIRDEGLWLYARDADGVLLFDYEKARFKEDYLYHFCRRNGVSISSTYGYLGTVESMQYLGWSNEEIASVGIKELDPVKFLVKVDGRSGEVKLPPPEIVEKLPPGDTVEERIAAKVKEVFVDPPEPLSPSDRRKAMVVDTGAGPSVNVFEAGDGDVWLTYERGDIIWDGAIIPRAVFDTITGEARDWLIKKLKITEYTRRKDE